MTSWWFHCSKLKQRKNGKRRANCLKRKRTYSSNSSRKEEERSLPADKEGSSQPHSSNFFRAKEKRERKSEFRQQLNLVVLQKCTDRYLVWGKREHHQNITIILQQRSCSKPSVCDFPLSILFQQFRDVCQTFPSIYIKTITSLLLIRFKSKNLLWHHNWRWTTRSIGFRAVQRYGAKNSGKFSCSLYWWKGNRAIR